MRVYLLLFSLYLGWQLLHLAVELRFLLEIRTFYNARLGLSDSELGEVGWEEVVRRLVSYQAASKFVIVKVADDGGAGGGAEGMTRSHHASRARPPSRARRRRCPRTTWLCACCVARTGLSR